MSLTEQIKGSGVFVGKMGKQKDSRPLLFLLFYFLLFSRNGVHPPELSEIRCRGCLTSSAGVARLIDVLNAARARALDRGCPGGGSNGRCGDEAVWGERDVARDVSTSSRGSFLHLESPPRRVLRRARGQCSDGKPRPSARPSAVPRKLLAATGARPRPTTTYPEPVWRVLTFTTTRRLALCCNKLQSFGRSLP